MFRVAAQYLERSGWRQWDVAQIGRPSAVVWLVFRPGEPEPAVVVKRCDTAQGLAIGRRECASLSLLRPYAAELSIPRLLFQSEDATGLYYVQTAMPGTPLHDELDPRGYEAIWQFEIAALWLGTLQRTVPPAGNLASVLQQYLPRVADQLPERFRTAAIQAVPRLEKIPAVAVHGDFWSHNVLTSSGRVSVIDWSTFHYGSPLEDLTNFAVASVYREAPDLKQSADRIWNVLLGSSRLGGRLRLAAGDALARFGVPPDLVGPLFWLSVVCRLSYPEFLDHAAWQAFVVRYAEAGMPEPFGA